MRLALTGMVVGLTFGLVATAQAATTIVNLNASSTNPNAGHNSGSYTYNPLTFAFAAGTYTVRVIGMAQGGMYDAFTVYAPSAGNAAYTDKDWSVSLNGGTSAAYTQAAVGGTVADFDNTYKAGRYNSAAQALAAYAPTAGYTFTLATAQNVTFYVDDSSSPYFGDDSGGVSLAVSSVPEPATLGLLAVGAIGLVFGSRRRERAAPASAT